MWPGEWSIVALRKVVTKHLAFGDIQDTDLRKIILEQFINEVLSNNASFASRGKLPMVFEKIEKLSNKFLNNKKHYENLISPLRKQILLRARLVNSMR